MVKMEGEVVMIIAKDLWRDYNMLKSSVVSFLAYYNVIHPFFYCILIIKVVSIVP